jgi:hypothetical protein
MSKRRLHSCRLWHAIVCGKLDVWLLQMVITTAARMLQRSLRAQCACINPGTDCFRSFQMPCRFGAMRAVPGKVAPPFPILSLMVGASGKRPDQPEIAYALGTRDPKLAARVVGSPIRHLSTGSPGGNPPDSGAMGAVLPGAGGGPRRSTAEAWRTGPVSFFRAYVRCCGSSASQIEA